MDSTKTAQLEAWDISAVDLVEWGYESLKQATDACAEEEPEYNFGDHCRFCNAKAKCPVYQDLTKIGEKYE